MKNPHRRALALDFGRVLTLDQDRSRFLPLLSNLGVEPEIFREAWLTRRLDYDRGTLDSPSYWTGVLGQCAPHLGPAEVAPLVQAFFEADYASWNRPRQPLIDLVRQALRTGTPTAIVSNMPPGLGPRFEADWPWLAEVDHRFWSAALGEVKPHPGFYAQVLAQTGWDPSQVLFVDDLATNLEGAARAGFRTLLFTGADQDLTAVAAWVKNEEQP